MRPRETPARPSITPRAWSIPFISLLAVAVVVLLAADAPAFYEPDGFRGVTWGTSLSRAEHVLKGLYAKRLLVGHEPTCESAPTGEAMAESARCVATMQMESVRMGLSFEFHQGAFVAVALVTRSASYTDLKRSFIARYGAPTRIEKKTKLGPFAEHVSEEVHWEGSRVRIRLSQYVGDLTLSVAVIGLRAQMDGEAADHEDSAATTFPLRK